jgi:hypothetical protein
MRTWFLLVLMISACEGRSSMEPPLSSGDYVFVHKFAEAEQSTIPSVKLDVQIRGRHIELVNNDGTDVFPAGVIKEGTLMWHAASREWIIGTKPGDVDAPEVGGCSDGPEVVDLERRIYWTC